MADPSRCVPLEVGNNAPTESISCSRDEVIQKNNFCSNPIGKQSSERSFLSDPPTSRTTAEHSASAEPSLIIGSPSGTDYVSNLWNQSTNASMPSSESSVEMGGRNFQCKTFQTALSIPSEQGSFINTNKANLVYKEVTDDFHSIHSNIQSASIQTQKLQEAADVLEKLNLSQQLVPITTQLLLNSEPDRHSFQSWHDETLLLYELERQKRRVEHLEARIMELRTAANKETITSPSHVQRRNVSKLASIHDFEHMHEDVHEGKGITMDAYTHVPNLEMVSQEDSIGSCFDSQKVRDDRIKPDFQTKDTIGQMAKDCNCTNINIGSIARDLPVRGTRPSFMSGGCNKITEESDASFITKRVIKDSGNENPSMASEPLLHSSLRFQSTLNLRSTASNSLASDAIPVNRETSNIQPAREPKPTKQEDILPAKSLVIRILSGKGQESSIALQHQLKSGQPARRREILGAMMPHFVELAEDKHGNFLVQRAISVDEEVAWRLKGHFSRLCASQFGCHVVQMILGLGEGIKATIVKELIASDVEQSLTCRYSIHVWQRILEARWSDKSIRKDIYQAINDAMRGKWAQAAMQETGSIVCQNIFESADDTEKSECLNEIMDQLCICAANQWGVWVAQHIIEHSCGKTFRCALDKLLQDPIRLSLLQYGQKAIMSALKSKDVVFLNGYVNALCETDPQSASSSVQDSTQPNFRPVLVEVANSASGLQIITQLITTVNDDQRDIIIRTVRRNSVFLKGSKSGVKVHQLCERARAYKGY